MSIETMHDQRRIPTVEVAKLVRARLKKEWPGVKFSVRSDSMGSSVDVSWTDGPTRQKVEEVLNQYAGARFDDMTDSKYYASTWLCSTHAPTVANTYGGGRPKDAKPRCCPNAEIVTFGADWVTGHRRDWDNVSRVLDHACDAEAWPAGTAAIEAIRSALTAYEAGRTDGKKGTRHQIPKGYETSVLADAYRAGYAKGAEQRRPRRGSSSGSYGPLTRYASVRYSSVTPTNTRDKD